MRWTRNNWMGFGAGCAVCCPGWACVGLWGALGGRYDILVFGCLAALAFVVLFACTVNAEAKDDQRQRTFCSQE